MSDYEEIRKVFSDVDAKLKEKEIQEENERLDELKKKGLEPFDSNKYPKKRCDHPNTMENSTATVIWIVVMLVGTIFKGNWIIWIIATVIWLKFITRYD